MTLLSIIQNACNELGIPAPDTVQTTADQRAVTLKALARREQIELARMFDWPSLNAEFSFNTVIGQGTYSLTNSVDKVLRDTVYNQSTYYGLRGSMTPAEWRFIVSSNSGFITPAYRVRLYTVLPEVEIIDRAGWTFSDPSITVDGGGFLTFNATPVNKFAFDNPLIPVEIGATYRFRYTLAINGAVSGSIRVQLGNVSGTIHNVAGGPGTFVQDFIAATADVPTFRTLASIAGGNFVISGISCIRVLSGITRSITIAPVPTVVEAVICEYKTLTTAFTLGPDGVTSVPTSLMTLDGDTTRLDESLIELGIKWRWLKSRGLDYGEEYRTYQDAAALRYAQDINMPSIPLAARRNVSDEAPITNGFVPDRGYGP